MKNLLLRTLTGIAYVVLLVGCTFLGPITAFAFFSIISMAALWEFGTILNKHANTKICLPVNSLAGLVLSGAVWLSCVSSPTSSKAFALYGICLLYLLIRELYTKSENPLRNWAYSFASQVYIAVPFALVSLIYIFRDATQNISFNWIYVLVLFVFLWINDTGAYLSGLCLHNVFPAKLFPRISPKKTWVGSVGGGVLTLAASIGAWKLCQSFSADETLKLSFWLGFALVVVVFGTWGDLVESLLKRQLNIKDSGHILPGHGGILDRFDSSLLAIPASIAYIYLTT